MALFENLEQIRRDVAACGREVTLVAASKTQTVQTIDSLMKAAPDFVLGENRVQELRDKFNPDYRWHFIGQLQTNKVKYVVDKVELIHSLDRAELAAEIERQAAKRNKIQKCLIEVNMGGEASKGGISPDSLEAFISSLAQYKHIEIDGIMSVLPNLDDVGGLRKLYQKLYGLYETAESLKQDNLNVKYLSAGMTNDYKIALEHGSNMLRLGRILFGERNYAANQIVD
jgi:pyridoxal phosphate enzyme (YggS family)